MTGSWAALTPTGSTPAKATTPSPATEAWTAFIDAGGNADTLIEARDLNFSLSDTELAITGQQQSAARSRGDGFGRMSGKTASTCFERFKLFGGAGDNNFAVDDFTKQAWLDGIGGQRYLCAHAERAPQRSVIRTRGRQRHRQYRQRPRRDPGRGRGRYAAPRRGHVAATGGPRHDGSFTLAYGGQTTEEIADADAADEIAAKLEDLSAIQDVTVTGSGTTDEPWTVEILDADVNAEGKFLRLQSNDETVATATVARATVQRIEASLAAAVLAGKPDLDAMFERPVNETQVFHLRSGSSGNFQLHLPTGTGRPPICRKPPTAAAIETALENLERDYRNVEVTGSGTGRDPWQVRITRADKDSNGNYYLLAGRQHRPGERTGRRGRCRGQTRPSISLSSPAQLPAGLLRRVGRERGDPRWRRQRHLHLR